MRRKLSAVAALLVVLAFCPDAPASAQGGGAKMRSSLAQRKRPPKKKASPTGAALGQRLTAAVAVKNFEFQPKSLTVKPGTVVTWTDEAGAHNITADDGSFSSPTLGAGQTFSHKFDRKGTYRYHCSFHGGAGGHDMAGTIVVQPRN